MQEKQILAVAWHTRGAEMLVPVIEKLRLDSKFRIVVVGYGYSEAVFEEQRVEFKTLEDYGLKAPSVDSMVEVFRKEKPDLIITGISCQDDEHPEVIEQSSITVAKRLEIKSLSLVGICDDYTKPFSDILSNNKFRFLPDKIGVIDEKIKGRMIKQGFDPDMIVVVGDPVSDGLAEISRAFTKEEAQAFKERIGLSKKVLFTYLGNGWRRLKKERGYWDMDNILIMNSVLNSLSPELKENIGWAVKLHPGSTEEEVEEIKNWLEENSPVETKFLEDVDLQKLMLSSSIIVVAYSSLGMDAVHMDIPCLSLQPNKKGRDLLTVSEYGIIPAAYSISDGVSLLVKALTDNSYRREMLKTASSFQADGRATDRVIETVEKMC